MTNTEIPRQLIDDAMDLSNAWGDVREDYSGRGMYGSECFGIVFESTGDQSSFLIALGMVVARCEDPEAEYGEAVDEDTPFALARAASQDSMGFSTIVYFPGYQLAD